MRPDDERNPSVALTVIPDAEATPIVLDRDVVYELIIEITAARREVAERRAPFNSTRT